MNIVSGLFVFIGCVALGFLCVDFFSAFSQWLNRIHIGRWNNMDDWKVAVERKALQWTFHCPTVKIKDQNRLVLWDMLQGEYRSQTIQSWQNAGLLLGINAGNDKIISGKYLSAFVDLKTGCLRSFPRQIDVALLGYALLNCKNIDKELIRSEMNRIFYLIMELKGSNETVPYREGVRSIRFVDTLGMICPFLSRYGVVYSCPEAISLAFAQLKEYDKALHSETFFPAHAFDMEKNVPLGIFDWGRGVGWYILAVTEVYRIVRDKEKRMFLEARIVSLGEQLLRFRHPSGGFSAQIFQMQSTAEASATVLAGLLFHECFKITSDVRYRTATEMTLKQLMRLTRRDGSLDFCQGDTKGIGNYSTVYGRMPFAQGMCLLLINRYICER